MTVAALFGPRSLLAVFPLTLSFYERTGMDEHQIHTNGTNILHRSVSITNQYIAPTGLNRK